MELLIVTGMSGAGKSQAANALEDMGYYCVDNIPPAIIPAFVELSSVKGEALNKIAIVTDIRGGELFVDINKVLTELKNHETEYKILFLDASDEVLVKRYKENRRMHPLSIDNGFSVLDAVKKEREILKKIRSVADYIIDTTYISNSQLKNNLSNIFFGSISDTLKIVCKSFGFKYGNDTEADVVFDVRCLPNPFYVEELKHKTGLDQEIRDFVMNSSDSKEFFKRLTGFLDIAVPLYAKEGKSQLTIAFGCTGGKHRSVTFAQLVGEDLKQKNYDCIITHRDINK